MKKTSTKKGGMDFFHQQAAEVGTTMLAIAAKLGMKPRSLAGYIREGTLPDDKVAKLAEELEFSPQEVQERIQKVSTPGKAKKFKAPADKKKGKGPTVKKVVKKPAAKASEKLPGESTEKKGGESDVQVLYLILRLKNLGLAGRVMVLGLDFLLRLERAQGQPLTDEALQALAELEGIMA